MRNIPLFHPYVPKDAIDEVVETLSGKWIGQAHKVDQFERDFGAKFGTKYNVSLNSGSAALETAFDLLNLEAGDEVISTPLTCTATNIPLLRKRIKIVWGDINPHNLCLDPKDVRRKITDRTKAIVNVHLAGIENDLGKMPVPIVADACQALGVVNGDYNCYSFQAIKHITTGDGGMLVVSNEDEYKTAKLMRWFGIDREKKIQSNWQAYKERQMTFQIDIHGYKRQMTDIAAGMGIAGLRHYEEIMGHLSNLFRLYKTLLLDCNGIRLVDSLEGCKNTHWLCTVLVDRRDDFAKMLHENGVDSNMVQLRNDIFNVFGGRRNDDVPVMDAVEGKYISLPLNMKVTEDDVQYICDLIKKGW